MYTFCVPLKRFFSPPALIADVPLEDPWIIAERLFSPGYVGGWSAAEYWGFTEQIFRSVVVMTTRKLRDRTPVIKNTKFIIPAVQEKALFGLKPIWRGQVNVLVSAPVRTVIDMLNDPGLGGGAHPAGGGVLSKSVRCKEKLEV